MELQSRKQLVFRNNLYKIAILTFVTTVLWIGFEIFRSYNKPEPTERIQTQIEPLNPNLDTELLDRLDRRIKLTATDFARLQTGLPQLLRQQQLAAEGESSSPAVEPELETELETFPAASPSATPAPPATPSASPSS